VLHYGGALVGRLSMDFLHHGIPMPTRKAVVTERKPESIPASSSVRSPQSPIRNPDDLKDRLLRALAHPNVASKHWIIRQYDHEVQGGSVVKPLGGPLQVGPMDAAVVRPKLGSTKGVVLSNGMAPHVSDPYYMAVAAIDEAVRNAVCVGADLSKLAILDNFCWPSVDDEVTMGTLVRACEACRDGALALGIPFISGKDSLHNQFTDQESGRVIRIPNTLLISAIGVIDDVRKCVTMDLKGRTNRVVMVAARNPWDLPTLAKTHRGVARVIGDGMVMSAHDVSDGGLAVAAAEMCIASGMGLTVGTDLFYEADPFAEVPGRYLLELRDPTQVEPLRQRLGDAATVTEVGLVQHLRKFTVTSTRERVLEVGLEELTSAWRATLDW
jgi:phosphoribosylformylglycinamidine synthase